MEPPRLPPGACICLPVTEHPVFIGPFLVELLLSLSQECFLPPFLRWAPLKGTGWRACRGRGGALPAAWGPGFQWPRSAHLGHGGLGPRPRCQRPPRAACSQRCHRLESPKRGLAGPSALPFALVQPVLGPRAASPPMWSPRLRTDGHRVSQPEEGPGSLELGRRICSPTSSPGPASPRICPAQGAPPCQPGLPCRQPGAPVNPRLGACFLPVAEGESVFGYKDAPLYLSPSPLLESQVLSVLTGPCCCSQPAF